MKQIFLNALGCFLLILGVIGIVLPLLPTTPFVIGAAACFSSNPGLQKKMMGVPLFREYIESYQNKKGISRKTLISSLSFLWGSLTVSMLLLWHVWATIGLICVGVGVTMHLFRLWQRSSLLS